MGYKRLPITGNNANLPPSNLHTPLPLWYMISVVVTGAYLQRTVMIMLFHKLLFYAYARPCHRNRSSIY